MDSVTVVRFVREVLGCRCPEEVFRTVRVEVPSPAEGPVALTVDVGGRLLVWLLRGDDVDGLAAALPALAQRAREARDGGGFNRIRLVIPDPGPDQAPALASAFAQACAGDAKCHVHLVAAQALAPLLSAADAQA